MKKNNILKLIEFISLKDLKSIIPLKEKLDALQKKKQDMEKSLADVNRQIESLIGSTGKTAGRGSGRPKGTSRKSVKRRKRRIAQPSLSSVVVEILLEKKKPMKVNEIHDAVLSEKGYKTNAKNFKAQLRVLLYKNDKGLFKKMKPGLFALAGQRKPTAKRKTQKLSKKSVKKKSTVKKKAPAPQKKAVKKVVKKRSNR